MNQKSDRDWIRSAPDVAVCGAYSIRPYPDGRNSIHFFTHSTTGVAACGAYVVAPYPGTRKNDDYFIPRIKTN